MGDSLGAGVPAAADAEAWGRVSLLPRPSRLNAQPQAGLRRNRSHDHECAGRLQELRIHPAHHTRPSHTHVNRENSDSDPEKPARGGVQGLEQLQRPGPGARGKLLYVCGLPPGCYSERRGDVPDPGNQHPTQGKLMSSCITIGLDLGMRLYVMQLIDVRKCMSETTGVK